MSDNSDSNQDTTEQPAVLGRLRPSIGINEAETVAFEKKRSPSLVAEHQLAVPAELLPSLTLPQDHFFSSEPTLGAAAPSSPARSLTPSLRGWSQDYSNTIAQWLRQDHLDTVAAQGVWQSIRGLPLFAGLPAAIVLAKITSGEVLRLELGRDQILNTRDRILLLEQGQIALAWFSRQVLDDERRFLEDQANRAPDREKAFKWRTERGPLAKQAVHNLAYFDEARTVFTLGELLGAEPTPPLDTNEDLVLAAFTVRPSTVVSVSAACFEEWLKVNAQLEEKLTEAVLRGRRRLERSPSRGSTAAPLLSTTDTVKDFFVRNGLSVATTLRVLDLTRCTGCGDCEQACADRYGVSRLKIHSQIIAQFDFVDCCRTCEDQRCVSECRYDAISYDNQLKEVRIFESHCTGCSKCAGACPYGAITMHDVDENPRFEQKLRLRAARDAKDLNHVDPDKEVARRSRVASKCDHCRTFFDGQQACISACQKDALYELTPLDIFLNRPPLSSKQLPPSPGQKSEAVSQFGLLPLSELSARQQVLSHAWRPPEPRLRTGWLWTISVVALGLLSVESFGVWYGPRSTPGLVLGVLATVLMVAAALYTPFARLQRLRRDAATRFAELDSLPLATRQATPKGWRILGRIAGAVPFHTWAGLVALLLVILHSQGRLIARNNFGVLGFWFMVVITFTGFITRYGVQHIQKSLVKLQRRIEEQNQDSKRANLAILRRHAQLLLRKIEFYTQLRPGMRHARVFHISAAVLCLLFVLLHIVYSLS